MRRDFGLVNLYKEKGISSFKAVEKVRNLFRIRKGGHGGTLDPEAEGVLPILLGRATKVSSLYLKSDKEYEVEFLLGLRTDTFDMAGKEIERIDEFSLGEESLLNALKSFEGTYLQVPPRYSAVKIRGKRAYDLARRGEQFDLPPREVTCIEARLYDYSEEVAKVHVTCMSGFYIRAMARDLSDKLGIPVTARKIVRVKTGYLDISSSRTLGELSAMKEEGRLEDALMSLDVALPQLPGILVDEGSEQMVVQGIRPESFLPIEPPPGLYKIKNRRGNVIALIEKQKGTPIKYRCVLTGN
jgi:tRNA pseudouridine55 synthase